jgi:hypothetical protein
LNSIAYFSLASFVEVREMAWAQQQIHLQKQQQEQQQKQQYLQAFPQSQQQQPIQAISSVPAPQVAVQPLPQQQPTKPQQAPLVDSQNSPYRTKSILNALF